MNNQITINPEVSIINHQPMVSSLNIADVFGKRHDNVVQSICNLQNDLETVSGGSQNSHLIFQEAEYLDAQKKPRASYQMNRDAFSLLVMGFTGKRALEWKLKYIAAFNMMEAELKAPAVAPVGKKGRKPRLEAPVVNYPPLGEVEKQAFGELIRLDGFTLANEILFQRKRHEMNMNIFEQMQTDKAIAKIASPEIDMQAIAVQVAQIFAKGMLTQANATEGQGLGKKQLAMRGAA